MSTGNTFDGPWNSSRRPSRMGDFANMNFSNDRVDYLGFEVRPRGIQASPNKVQAIVKWPKLKSVHDV